MSERIRITDVSPRDGLQNEPGIIATRDKVLLVERLLAAGLDEIEVTSFVSAKWVPQLGDASGVIERLASPLPEGGGGGVGSTISRIPYTVPPRLTVARDRAAALRRTMTEGETRVWSRLSNRQLGGLEFRRQHPFGPYILDFFCAEAALAIELDGPMHAGLPARERDAKRTGYIEAHGVTVWRVSAQRAFEEPDGVALEIRREIERKLDGSLPRTRDEAISRREPTPQPPPSGRGASAIVAAPTVMSVLVPNEKGLEGLLAVLGRVGAVVSKIALFTAASETFARKNTNATIAETLERFGPVIRGAHGAGLTVRGYISCVVACPFEGVIEASRVAEVASRLVEIGVDEIDLGDTIGAGTPESIARVLGEVRQALGEAWWTRERLTLHLHDTFGRAASCVRAGLDHGVRSFDGSVAGLGGCPYASTPGRRAPGNIDTALLVRTVHDAGYSTGVDLAALEAAAAFARGIVAASRAGGDA